MATPTWVQGSISAQMTIGGSPLGENAQKTSGAGDVFNAHARTVEQLAAVGDYITYNVDQSATLYVGLTNANVTSSTMASYIYAHAFNGTSNSEVRESLQHAGDITVPAGRTTWRIELVDVGGEIRPRISESVASVWTTRDTSTIDITSQLPISFSVSIATTSADVDGIDITAATPPGGGGSAPTTYNLRADTTPVIPAGWPGSSFALETPAVGASVIDPNFGTRVYRMTGPANSANGGSCGLTGAPNLNAIASDDAHVLFANGNFEWVITNFNTETGVFSEDHRITPGKDPGFARAASKPNTIYVPRFNGLMRFDSYDIASRVWTVLFDVKASSEVPTAALVSDRDFQTEIYSSEAENPEMLVMSYGGSEIMILGNSGASIHGQVLVTSQAQNDIAGRTVTISIAPTANAALAVSDTSGALSIVLGTDAVGGVASTTKNTATLIRAAVDALAGWIADLPRGSTGANAITQAMATRNLSGSSSGIQENWMYVTAINANSPGTRWTYDLWRGLYKADGGSWTQVLNHDGTNWAGRCRVHSLSIDRSGDYINVDVSGTSARRLVINLNTSRVHDVTNNSWLGHYCMGWGKEVNATEDGARPPQWLLHDYSQGGTFPVYSRLISPVYPGAFVAHGEHSNWNNARSDSNAPIATGTGYSAQLYSWETYQANAKPLLGEIALVATEPNTAQGTNQFYRACSSQMQNYDTGLNGDTATYAANRNHFRMNQFVQITHDGRWIFFVSNWNYTLGVQASGFGRLLTDYSTALPAGVLDYRRDVFFVRLDRELLPGQASVPTPANTATGVGLDPTLSWTAGATTLSHTVRFGTSNPPPVVVASQTETTYTPGTLLYSTTYYWRVDETNNSGTTNGTVWSFTTIPAPPVNVAPTVSLTAPITGQIFTLGLPVTLTATAADSDGSIALVEFFDGATLIGSASAAPYTFVWTNASLGDHDLQAKATDNQGATTMSAIVPILVIPVGVPPHRKFRLTGVGTPSPQEVRLPTTGSKRIRLTR